MLHALGHVATTRFGYILGIACLLTGAAMASELEPVREGQETMISRAVFAEGKLWVMSDAGQLMAITEGKSGREDIQLPEPAVQLWRQDGAAAVATCPRERCKTWTLRRHVKDAWETIAQIQSERPELLLSVSAENGETLIFTTNRIISLRNGAKTTTRVRWQPPHGPLLMASVLAGPDQLYVGFDLGEWGGGFRTVDRKTGTMKTIEYNATRTLCGGPLNTGCDPVNGIVTDPWKPGCVLAVVGLVHMSSHGRIVEICGDAVRRHYYRPFGDEPKFTTIQPGEDEPFSTVAFFGLARNGEDVIAAGVNGMYRVTKDGAEPLKDLPKFVDAGGIRVSFDVPGYVLLLTEINSRAALSGAVPMLVPR